MDHYDAVEAALLAEYGVDLGEAIYGRAYTGARRLWALVSNLPLGSAVHRALEPEAWSWGNLEEMLALVVEFIDHSNRMFFAAHNSDKTPVWDPVRVPRPGRPRNEPRRMATSEELLHFVRHGAES